MPMCIYICISHFLHEILSFVRLQCPQCLRASFSAYEKNHVISQCLCIYIERGLCSSLILLTKERNCIYRFDDSVEGLRTISVNVPLNGLSCVKAHHLKNPPLALRMIRADLSPNFDILPHQILVNIRGPVEDGEHQPHAEHKLHVRPERKPARFFNVVMLI